MLTDDSLSPYGRYRLLHHLIKPRRSRGGGVFRFIEQFSVAAKHRIEALAPSYLAAPAFEFNLIALYHLQVSGRSVAELRRIVAENTRQGCEPVRNALEAVARVPRTQMPSASTIDEPDAFPEPTS